MRTSRPFSATIAVLIVALAVVGSAHSFLSDGGVQYYAERPVRILLVVGASAFLGFMVWFASRRFPRLLPLLDVLSVVVMALVLTTTSVLIACTIARFWTDEALGQFRWVGVGLTTALGALAVVTWRESQEKWKAFRNLGRNGQPSGSRQRRDRASADNRTSSARRA